MRIKNLIKLRKKAFIISVVAILLVLILPLVSSGTFTPQGDADFRDVYALYNVTDITGSGNIDIDGNITANDITLSGIINISGNITSQNIIPITNNTYDLGSTSLTWDKAYLKSLEVGSINTSSAVVIAYNASNEITSLTITRPLGNQVVTPTYVAGTITQIASVYLGDTTTTVYTYTDGYVTSIAITHP